MSQVAGRVGRPIDHCRLCGEVLGGPSLDFGELPPCNRFASRCEPLDRHRMVMSACTRCGLAQLVDPMPVEMVRPRIGWLAYNEPEGHLDDLAAHILTLAPGRNPTALGMGPFEGPLHRRFADHGMAVAQARLAVEAGAGRYPYLETWQDALSTGALGAKARPADIVTCRYLLEHCHDPLAALAQLRALVAPEGLLVIEVPDSSKFFAARDYGFPWEEHISYFVEETLRDLCGRAGFEIVSLRRYSGALEDALVAIMIKSDPSQAPQGDAGLFRGYCEDFDGVREKLRHSLATVKGKLALFGLGHQSIFLSNACGIAERFDLAIDDNPDKIGTFPPGFRVAVSDSHSLLAARDVGLCLLAVSPRAEDKVRALLAPLAERGAEFRSVFAGVPGSIVSRV